MRSAGQMIIAEDIDDAMGATALQPASAVNRAGNATLRRDWLFRPGCRLIHESDTIDANIAMRRPRVCVSSHMLAFVTSVRRYENKTIATASVMTLVAVDTATAAVTSPCAML